MGGALLVTEDTRARQLSLEGGRWHHLPQLSTVKQRCVTQAQGKEGGRGRVCPVGSSGFAGADGLLVTQRALLDG